MQCNNTILAYHIMIFFWRSGQTWVAWHTRSLQNQDLNGRALPDVAFPVRISILRLRTCMTKRLTISKMIPKYSTVCQACMEQQIPAGNYSDSRIGLSSSLLGIKYFTTSDEVGSLSLRCLWERFDLWWVLGQHQDSLRISRQHTCLCFISEGQYLAVMGGFLHHFSKRNSSLRLGKG